MDNLTHTLMGVSLGMLLAPVKKSKARAAVIGTAVVASNLPDFDLLTGLWNSSPLTYLVYHRGYSHSLVFLLPMALALTLLFWWVGRWRKWNWSRQEVGRLFAAGVLGLLFHMLFDGMNSYGIHLGVPFDRRWFYGDAVFIIEPWLWAALLPLTLLSLAWGWRALLSFLCLGVMAAGIRQDMISPLVVGAVVLVTLGFFFGLRRWNPRRRASISLLAVALVIGVFATASIRARAVLTQAFDAGRGFVLKDLVLSPFPGTPWCWTYLTVEENESTERYRVSAGHFRLFRPGMDWVCPAMRKNGGLELAAGPSSFKPLEGLSEEGVYEVPLRDLVSGYKESCLFQSWFTFARVPYRSSGGGGAKTGDHAGADIGDHAGADIGDHAGADIGDHAGADIGDHAGASSEAKTGDHTGAKTGDHAQDNFGNTETTIDNVGDEMSDLRFALRQKKSFATLNLRAHNRCLNPAAPFPSPFAIDITRYLK
jgi:inner membrane protein